MQHVAQLLVGDLRDAAPGRNAGLPQRLGLPQVADPGDRALVEKRFPDRAGAVAAQIRHHRLEGGRVGEDVGAEATQGAVVELEHRPVPEDGLALRTTQDQPRPADKLRAFRSYDPAPGHPQVAAQDEVALEPQEEVLAGGLDREQAAPVQLLRHTLDRRARMRSLDLDPLAHEHLQPQRRAGQRIAFGHARQRTPGRCCHTFVEMAAFTNIAAVARRTGVAVDTLRKWEERYSVLLPTRSAGGHRRYSDVDVARVEWLKARLDEGYRIGEAAAMLGTTSVDPTRTPRELREAIYAALQESDIARLRELLDQTFAIHAMPRALNDVIAPLLTRTGDGWASGELTVAHEHLLSAEVRARVSPLATSTAAGVRGSAVLACAPGERHELGLLMVAALLRSDGWRVAYLGSDTPVDAAVAMARWLHADLVGFSATIDERIDRLARQLKSTRASEHVAVVLGGRATDERTARDLGARWGGATLGAAVRTARALRR